jgi:two-component system sensor histidine kinase UhpB
MRPTGRAGRTLPRGIAGPQGQFARDGAGTAARRRGPPKIPLMNLRQYLLIRVTLVGLMCWVGVSMYVVTQAGRRTAQNMTVVADKLQAMISLDVMQRLLSTGSDAGYPALSSAADYFADPLCLNYRAADGSTSRYGCSPGPSGEDYPHWLMKVLAALGPRDVELQREISLWSRTAGVLGVKLDEERLLEREWRSIKELLELTAVTLLVLAVLIFWVFGRALRPTAKIVAALEELGSGRDYVSMPYFQPREFGLISDGINRLAARLAQSTRVRDNLTARLIQLQEAERREIVHELHEEFGQSVAGFSAVGMSLRSSVLNGERVTETDIERLEDGIESMLTSLRNLLQRMSSSPRERQGLKSALADLVAAWRSRLAPGACVAVDFESLDGDMPNDERALCVYRIVQECLSNVVRHAPTSRRISISVREGAQQLRVEVANECVEAAKGRTAAATTTGMGLLLLEERVRCLQGRFTVVASASEFMIQAALPTVGR